MATTSPPGTITGTVAGTVAGTNADVMLDETFDRMRGSENIYVAFQVPSDSRVAPVARRGRQRGLLSRDLHVVAREGDVIVGETHVTVWILDDSDEYRELRPQPDNLRAIAAGTQGEVITTGAQLAKQLRELPNKRGEVIVTRTPSWDRPLFLTFLVVLLGTEWILRRRAGYG